MPWHRAHIPSNSFLPSCTSRAGAGALCIATARTTGRIMASGLPSSPHLARDVEDQFELRFLLIDGERVAFGVAREAALRAERELLDRHELRGLVDPPLHVVLLLERARLRRHQPEDDRLALRHEAQRPEVAGARAVVLEEVAGDFR